jgi:superfamily I DNA/RNA helicase
MGSETDRRIHFRIIGIDMDERWLIDARDLDDFQKVILGYPLDQHLVVSGCAGSGKTLIALHRVRRLQEQLKDEELEFFFLVKTYSLKKFIQSAILQLGVKVERVELFSKWEKTPWPGDYIVLDEAQDISLAELERVLSRKRTAMMAFGDDSQQIFQKTTANEPTLKIQSIADKLGVPLHMLTINHRTPVNIAKVSRYFTNDIGFESKCKRKTLEKPFLKQFNTPEEELHWIATVIKENKLQDVGILLPFNKTNAGGSEKINLAIRNTVYVAEKLKEFGLTVEVNEKSVQEGHFRTSCKFDFSSTNPKIVSYAGVKGLQFETVFMPFCNFPTGYQFQSYYEKQIFVALTRSLRRLFITHHGQLSETFATIPSSLFTAL